MNNNQNREVSRRAIFDSIVELSRKMKTLAEDSKWDGIARLQKVRQELLLVFFSESVNLDEASWVEAGIQEMLSLDKAVMEKGRLAVQGISGELKTISSGKKASNAYLDNS